jgi:precorrin-6B methylase 2
MQLEFFPHRELKALSDFQSLEFGNLSLEDRKNLCQQINFFKAPNCNIVIENRHSELIDKILGFRMRYVEEMLQAEAAGFDPDAGAVQTWMGLDLQVLQTPYSQILRILQLLKLKPSQHVVDLGAAYGRMGIVIGGRYIKSFFTGYEFVKARADEGNRIFKELDFNRCRLVTQDLAHRAFSLPEADIYFIYDYGQVEHIDRTLRQLEEMSHRRPVKVVVRGRFTKEIIAHAHHWLNLQYEGKLNESFSIYSAYTLV